MFHGTLTLITPLRPEAVEAARSTLEELSRAIQSRGPHPFRQLEELYFAHWGICGDEAQHLSDSEPSPERFLVFGADLRLTDSLRGQAQLRAAVKLFVERLAAQRPEWTRSFDALYRHCEGYPSQGLRAPEQVERYFLAHAVPYNTRHIDFAYRVSPVADIRGLLSLRERVESFLNEPHRSAWVRRVGVRAVHRALRERVAPVLASEVCPTWRCSLRCAFHAAALSTLAYLPLDLPLHLALRLKNWWVKPGKTTEYATVPDSVREQIETRQGPVQNSMILITSVSDHWLDRLRQRFYMALVNLRLIRNVVGLNDTRTIHIARWALFKGGSRRRMLFMVTYDESWESYIDTFVDNQDIGTFLKLLWKGTRGFPSGMPFVDSFKQWIRSVQCPLQVHYSAFLHGGERPQPFALTDLHECSKLRRVLTGGDSREQVPERHLRALSAFLQQGCFPPQDKLLSPWRSFLMLCEQQLLPLRSALRSSSPPARPALSSPTLPPPPLSLSRSVTHVSKT